MKALVLAGGGAKGAWQAGAISSVLKSGFNPDVVYGVSVGSLNAMFLASRAFYRQNPTISDLIAVGSKLEDFWMHKIFSPDKLLKKRKTPSVVLDIISNRFKGMFDMSPLHDLIKTEIKDEEIYKSPLRINLGCVNVKTGEFISATNEDEDIIEYGLASTKIPLIMEPHKIDNEYFADGGLRNVSPLRAAIKDGAEEIVAISCQARALPAKPKLNVHNIKEIGARTIEILVDEIAVNDLDVDVSNVQRINNLVTNGLVQDKRHINLTYIIPSKYLDISLTKFTQDDIISLVRDGQITGLAQYEKRNL